MEVKQTEVDEASWTFYNLPFELPSTWLDTTMQRRVISAIAQDQFRAGERVTLTATVRYDDYDDLGAFASRRAAAVWRIDEENILKLQLPRPFARRRSTRRPTLAPTRSTSARYANRQSRVTS